MNNKDVKNIFLHSDKQSGGITAQNVTINNYGPWSKGLGKISFYFKTKVVRWSLFTALLVGCATFLNSYLQSETPIDTKDRFHAFASKYLESVSKSKEDAEEFFANKISRFYLEKDIDPARVNTIRRTTDYKESLYNIDKESITLYGKTQGITYWRFISGLICFRPSKNMYQKCNVEMEYGINAQNKICSIEQIKAWDLNYSNEIPTWN
jgi:hypothetical protein